MNEVENAVADGRVGEKHIRKLFKQSVARFGMNHTHDLSCQTWRGHNYIGGCNCTLPDREVTSTKTRTGVYGPCDAQVPHEAHIFAFGVTDTDGNQVLQECPGQYSECANCDDRKCMDCVLRIMHDACEESCPMCCGLE